MPIKNAEKRKEYFRKWRLKNKDKIKAGMKKYYKDNKEKFDNYQKQYKSHPEVMVRRRQYYREYYSRPGIREKYRNNPKINERTRQYYLANKEVLLSKRRAKYNAEKIRKENQNMMFKKPSKATYTNRPTEMIDDFQKKILLQKYKLEEIKNLTMLQALQLIAENLKKK